MTKYFKFVGVILIILFLVAAILEIVVFVQTVDYLEGASLAISIVEIALFLIIGPALGMLFISYANHKEEHDFKDDFDEDEEEDDEDEEDDYVENSSTPKKSISELPVSAKYDIEDIEIDGPIIKLGSRSFRMTLISDVHLRKDNIDLIAFGVRYKIYFDNEKRGYSLYQTILDNFRQI